MFSFYCFKSHLGPCTRVIAEFGLGGCDCSWDDRVEMVRTPVICELVLLIFRIRLLPNEDGVGLDLDCSDLFRVVS